MTEQESSGRIPDHLVDLYQALPLDWDHPLETIANVLYEQSGILPAMASRNPELLPRLTDFLVGDVNLQIVGGESASGKSLITGDIRDLHGDLSLLVPPHLRHDLAVISYDRTHEVFFIELNFLTPNRVPIPKGETPIDGRKMVSGVLLDQVNFVKNYLPNGTKILVETPLIDARGEALLDSVRRLGGEAQVFIMHSPESRGETLQEKTRFSATSGQVEAMEEMRDKLLYRIAGPQFHAIPEGLRDTLILNWWKEKMNFWDGIVVEWDPNDNRKGYDQTRSKLIERGIAPDQVEPVLLDRVARSQFGHIFDTITDFDDFVRKFMQ